MTIDISNNNPVIEYSVSEGFQQALFTVPFDYFENTDVQVYVDGVLKVEGTHYTMVGGDGSTGTITFFPPVTGATGGSTVMVVREVALERVTDFVAGQDINRAALNTQLDALTAIAADIDSKINRSLRFPMSSNILDPLPESDRASKYFAFNAEGNPVFVNGTTSDIVVSSFVEPILGSANSTAFLSSLGIDDTIMAYGNTLTAANKIPYATGVDTVGELDFKDEDDMASDSATAVPSQQSVKAYVAAQATTDWQFLETIYDHSVDGDQDGVVGVESSAFADGYEYMMVCEDIRLSTTGREFIFNIYLENAASWVGGVFFASNSSVLDDLWASITLPLARASSVVKFAHAVGHEDANLDPTVAGSYGNAKSESIVFSCGGSDKVSKFKLTVDTTANFISGKVMIYRRKI